MLQTILNSFSLEGDYIYIDSKVCWGKNFKKKRKKDAHYVLWAWSCYTADWCRNGFSAFSQIIKIAWMSLTPSDAQSKQCKWFNTCSLDPNWLRNTLFSSHTIISFCLQLTDVTRFLMTLHNLTTLQLCHPNRCTVGSKSLKYSLFCTISRFTLLSLKE